MTEPLWGSKKLIRQTLPAADDQSSINESSDPVNDAVGANS